MLSQRLGAIAEYVPHGYPVVDVGCDHAYLPIELVEKNIIPFAYASDVRKGPLARADEHIRNARLEDRIKTVLCDGVPELSGSDLLSGGTLIIAGMGGILMKEILLAAKKKLHDYTVCIFEPQSHLFEFRASLNSVNLRIDDERMIYEEGKYYTIIKTVSGSETLTEEELLFGPVLLKKRDHLFYRYLKKQKAVQERIIKELIDADRVDTIRAEQVREELTRIKEVLTAYEM